MADEQEGSAAETEAAAPAAAGEALAPRLYLITGASGFLGYHLVRQLVEDGAAVKIFDLNPPGFDRGFLWTPRCTAAACLQMPSAAACRLLPARRVSARTPARPPAGATLPLLTLGVRVSLRSERRDTHLPAVEAFSHRRGTRSARLVREGQYPGDGEAGGSVRGCRRRLPPGGHREALA